MRLKWRNRLDLLGFATARDGISTKQLDNIKLPLRLAQSEFSQRGPNISPGGARPPGPPSGYVTVNWIVLVNSLNTDFQFLRRKCIPPCLSFKFNHTYKACWGWVILISLFKFRTNNIPLFSFNIIFFSLLDSDWLKSVPINP